MIKWFKQYLAKKMEALNKITSESWDGWVDAAMCPPSEFIGNKCPPMYFICAVLVPKYGGVFDRKCMILAYDWLAEKWVCEDVIVTHWRYCPEPPKEPYAVRCGSKYNG